MSDSLFFIDTNPDEVISVNTKNKDDKLPEEIKKEKTNPFEKDREEKKIREKEKNKERENNLSTFLFGNQTSKKDDVKEEKDLSDEDEYIANMKKVKKKEKKQREKEELKKAAEVKNKKKKKEADKIPLVEVLKSDGGSASEDSEEEGETSSRQNEQQNKEIKDSEDISDGWSDLEKEDDDAEAQGSDSSAKEESSDEENDGDDSSDEDNAENTNVFDMIPEDTFGKSLSLAGSRKRKAAWEDEADEQFLVRDKELDNVQKREYNEKKKNSSEKYIAAVERKFKGVVGEPAWASLDNKVEKDDLDSDDEFFQETTDIVEKKRTSSRLPKGRIDIKKCAAMNVVSNDEGKEIHCVDFHPTSTVGLVSGSKRRVTIMQIDGKHNPKIQSVRFDDTPIQTCKFSADGNEIIVGSIKRKRFHVFDMIAGKIVKVPMEKSTFGVEDSAVFDLSSDGKLMAIIGHTGSIQIYTATSKEFIGNLQMNDNCRALAFSKSGRKLYTHGEGGEFYVWDMNSRTCESKLVDDGCISGTSLAVNSNYLACGSHEGVVNIYSLNKLSGMKTGYPKPDKTLLNISEPINHLNFNPTGEILGITGVYRKRLVHFPSMTVFENWPESHDTNVICYGMKFSPGSGFMAHGINFGEGRLHRIQHYKDY